MEIEYTGRQIAVTDEMRQMAGPILDRVEKMLGRGASAHVIVTTEKNRQIAEVQVKSGAHDLVGLSESTSSMETALHEALHRAEAQAIRFKEKRATQQRLPKDEKMLVEPALERGGKGKRTALLATADSPLDEVLGIQPDLAPGTVSTLNGSRGTVPARELAAEPHVTRTIEAIALRPMSLEEAVKEMETRNREIFVFRDRTGLVRILHCRRDGILELIELP